MEIRSPQPPDDGGADADADRRTPPADDLGDDDWTDDSEHDGVADLGPIDQVTFRVPSRVFVAKFVAAAVIAVASAFAPLTAQLVVGLVAAAGVAAYAARDVIARARLHADASGVVVVRGYAGHRHLGWEEIERLSVDDRSRLGARTSTLEVDADAEIYFFTRNDLGVDPVDALAVLEKVRVS